MNSLPRRIVPASADHAEAIAELLVPYVPQGIVLPRSPEEVRRLHADFLVALDGATVVGAVALFAVDQMAESTFLLKEPSVVRSGCLTSGCD